MSDSVSVNVGNVSSKVAETELKELFECCGPVLRAQADSVTGHWTITYGDISHARNAVSLSGTPLDNQPITVSEIDAATTEAKKADEVARTIHVSNVHTSVTEQQLQDFFSTSCGNVLLTKLAGDQSDGLPTRFAFVEFATIGAAHKAMNLGSPTLEGCTLKIRKSNVPILKISAPSPPSSAKKDLDDIMAKVLAATKKLGATVERSRSRDRASRSRDRSSRSSHRTSRDRSRRSSRSRERESRERRSRESRSRSRRRRSSPSRSRSRKRGSRSPSPLSCYNCGETGHISRQCPKPQSRSRSPGAIKRKMKMPDRSGMIFNGYKWESIQNHSGITQTTGGRQPVQAVQLLQQALLVKQAKKIGEE